MIAILAFLAVLGICLCLAEIYYERDYPRIQGPYALAAVILLALSMAVFA